MANQQHEEKLTIDPVGMQIVNRIASGTALRGEQQFSGGVLVQGSLGGATRIEGRLIVWSGGTVSGHVVVLGDLYLFGQLGVVGGAAEDTVLECMGTAYVASTARSSGTLMAQRLRLYEGADLQGPFKTLKPNRAVPTLSDVPSSFPME